VGECGPERLTEVKFLFAEVIICLSVFELGCCEDVDSNLEGIVGIYTFIQ